MTRGDTFLMKTGETIEIAGTHEYATDRGPVQMHTVVVRLAGRSSLPVGSQYRLMPSEIERNRA